jgi:hypothetical protein
MADEKVLINDNYSVAFMPGISAAVSTEVKKITRPNFTINKDAANQEILFWGDDNDFPQNVIGDVRKDPEIGTLLNKQAALLYSSGLSWGIPKIVDGVKRYEPLTDAENLVVKEFNRKTNINRYVSETAKDLYWFSNAFPEIILEGSGKKIIQICAQAAEECRFGTQNKSTGLIDTCYINAQWPDGKANDPLTKKIPVLDSYYDPASQLRENLKGLNYIYPISVATPGNKFYQLADWNSIRESGWLEVSQEIPKFKKALLKNQMHLKYHIQISQLYWEKKFPGWSKLSDKEKNTKMREELDAIQATLVGAQNAGKSIRSIIHHDFNGAGKEFEMMKITPIDDKIQDGKYLEDGKDASTYKMSAIGLHPALIGTLPNNGMAGAGSNIREAYNLHMFLAKPMQDLILEPLNNLIIPFNGWNPEMEYYFNNQLMTTLDAGKEVKTKTT